MNDYEKNIIAAFNLLRDNKVTPRMFERWIEENTDWCGACGKPDGTYRGSVFVECCGRCNQEWYIGECKSCKGTGVAQPNGESNYLMIKAACEASKGYLCGMGDN